MTYQQEHREQFERLETPKWKRSPLPDALFPDVPAAPVGRLAFPHDGVSVQSMELAADGLASKLEEMEAGFVKNMGPAFLAYAKGHANTGWHIKGEKNRKAHLHYQAELTDSPLVDHWYIEAERGSDLTVIMDVKGSGTRHGLTRIHAEPDSRVKVVRLQRLGETSHWFDQTHLQVSQGAHVEVYDVQLGAAYVAVACQGDLLAPTARSEMYTAYMGQRNDLLDLGYTANHFGHHSESVILSKGVLDDAARKVFRGNLDFKTGAVGSVGQEEETALLLAPTVKSDAIPTLMCSEDDVIGEHAASASQLDEDKLFYLMSRGLSERTARLVAVEAALAEVLTKLPDDQARQIALDEVERRLSHAQ